MVAVEPKGLDLITYNCKMLCRSHNSCGKFCYISDAGRLLLEIDKCSIGQWLQKICSKTFLAFSCLPMFWYHTVSLTFWRHYIHYIVNAYRYLQFSLKSYLLTKFKTHILIWFWNFANLSCKNLLVSPKFVFSFMLPKLQYHSVYNLFSYSVKALQCERAFYL